MQAPLVLVPLELLQFQRPLQTHDWEKISTPIYWFGDRVLTKKYGWGTVSGLRRIASTGEWGYYLDLDIPINSPKSQPFPFFAEEIEQKHQAEEK
jgi:hypothetical protein